MAPRLPETAAWRHLDAREGFEVLFIAGRNGGWRFDGCTAAAENGAAWTVSYAIDVDASWRTRRARITSQSASGERTVEVVGNGCGHWHVDGQPLPDLDGCLDIDLESSALTNALPAHRLGLVPGAAAQAPAAYVRAADLGLERLEQRYTRLADSGPGQRYDYEAPSFDLRSELAYDEAGLLLAYPGLAIRVG